MISAEVIGFAIGSIFWASVMVYGMYVKWVVDRQ